MWNSTEKVIGMINRDKYLNDIIKSKDNGFPKVITGIRRCGKSYLLNNIFKERITKANCSIIKMYY
jgi:predicted AAA+ superfamily ATPase